ncbi:hypothetical protein HrrHc1_100 [Halorubrum phage Hardycor1]|nr:hypothetical protein HrrHc1_100 [Halorubrum phage Hardycor1]
MIVENENTATRRIASDDVLDAFESDPRPVEFDEDGRARVPAEVGEYLAETRDTIAVAVDERDTNEEP